MKKNLVKIVLGLSVIAFAIIPVYAENIKNFSDVNEHYWAAPQIQELSEKGVIVGYPDGTFKPDANVSRAEFACMAIKALGQEHTTVAQPVNFTDITPEYWAYSMIQRALYFDLISNPTDSDVFRPNDPVSHAEAVAVTVNALTTELISTQKAKEVLRDYIDLSSAPDWYILFAGKAEILNMLANPPGAPKALNSNKPATRAEIAVLLKNMIEQAQLNPNKKLAEAMRKKTGEGFVIPQAFVQGSIGTIPAGSVVPIKTDILLSSQLSRPGEVYMAKATQNYVTRDKYILIYKDSQIQGQLIDVRAGKLFVRNGVLVLSTKNITTTTNDQCACFKGVGEICKNKNWFIAFLRNVFKGEKLQVMPNDTVYIKLLSPMKIDLTNGWVIE